MVEREREREWVKEKQRERGKDKTDIQTEKRYIEEKARGRKTND